MNNRTLTTNEIYATNNNVESPFGFNTGPSELKEEMNENLNDIRANNSHQNQIPEIIKIKNNMDNNANNDSQSDDDNR
jgi:hypothetical protein